MYVPVRHPSQSTRRSAGSCAAARSPAREPCLGGRSWLVRYQPEDERARTRQRRCRSVFEAVASPRLSARRRAMPHCCREGWRGILAPAYGEGTRTVKAAVGFGVRAREPRTVSERVWTTGLAEAGLAQRDSKAASCERLSTIAGGAGGGGGMQRCSCLSRAEK